MTYKTDSFRLANEIEDLKRLYGKHNEENRMNAALKTNRTTNSALVRHPGPARAPRYENTQWKS